MSRTFSVAIAGATGAVGVEFLELLASRDFPIKSLKLLASARSVGKTMPFRGENLRVEELTRDSFRGLDFALFSAGSGVSKEMRQHVVEAGATLIDNSSAFRMEPDVPLVIPEINPQDLRGHKHVIAVPNCTTIVALMAVAPLHRTAGLRRIVASSYQAISGAGAAAMAELEGQARDWAAARPLTVKAQKHQILFNVYPHIDSFTDNGYTKEEMKLLNEGRKILGHPALRASITCVRVPVLRSHSVAINAEFDRPITPEEARTVLSSAPGVEVVDEPLADRYPMPLFQAGKDDVAVGRIRRDVSCDGNGLCLWAVGDQLRKGAALNAVQIAETLVAMGLR